MTDGPKRGERVMVPARVVHPADEALPVEYRAVSLQLDDGQGLVTNVRNLAAPPAQAAAGAGETTGVYAIVGMSGAGADGGGPDSPAAGDAEGREPETGAAAAPEGPEDKAMLGPRDSRPRKR